MFVSYQPLNITVGLLRANTYSIDARGPAGEARGELTLPVEDPIFDTALQAIRQLRADRNAAVIVGQILFQCLFQDDVAVLYERSCGLLQEGQGLRLEIAFDVIAAPIANLPWEYLQSPVTGQLSLQHVSVVRYLRLLQQPTPLRVELPLRVLLTAAQTHPPIAVTNELAAIEQALRSLGTFVYVHTEPHLTAERLHKLLQEKYHIWHFVGHGSRSSDGSGRLMLEDAFGDAAALTTAELVPLLSRSSIRLAVIQACQGATVGSEMLRSLAPALVGAGVPTVVAMQFMVAEESTRAFATAFYGALAGGLPLDTCIGEGRLGVLRTVGPLRPDWGVPVVYTRTSDGRLFDLPPHPKPVCPYPGLLAYQKQDAQIFYGREDEINDMIQRLRYQRMLFIIGVSGSGKSSLINAGFLSRLAKNTLFPSDYWLIRTFCPGKNPYRQLEAALDDQESPEQPDSSPAISPDEEGILHSQLSAQLTNRRLLLIIDQLEEIFTQADLEQRQRFISALNTLRKDERCTLVLAMRADFFSELMTSDLWPVNSSERIEITPLRGEMLRQALERPALSAQVWVEPALVQRLVDDAADEPGALPLIQETMTLLWAQMPHRILTLDLYKQLGDDPRGSLGTAMESRGNAAIAQLSAAQQMIAWRSLLRLVQFGEGRSDTRRRQPVEALMSADDNPADVETTLNHLANQRVIVIDHSAGSRTVDLAHEALITGWSTMQQWLRNRRTAEEMRRRLEDKVAEWVRFGRGEASLLDAVELDETTKWLQLPDSQEIGVSVDLLALVAKSRAAAKPQWHVIGASLIAVFILTLAGLSGLLYSYLQTIVLRDTSRLTVWLAILALSVVPILIFLFARRSETYPLRRFSYTIARPIGSAIVIALAAVTSGLWWLLISELQRSEVVCADFVGAATADPRIAFAVINRGVDPLAAEVFVLALRNGTNNAVLGWITTPEQEAQCRRFFHYRLILRKANAGSAVEAGYFADVEDLADQVAPHTIQIIGKDRCGLVGLLAYKTLIDMRIIEGTVVEDRELGGPDQCEPYWAHEAGFEHLRRKEYLEAEQLFRSAIEQFPDYPLAYMHLGEVYYQTNRYQEAVTAMRRAMGLVQNPPDFMLTQLAIACYRADDYPCAEQANLSALMVSPNLFRAQNNLGIVYREWGRYDAAKRAFDRAEQMLTTNNTLADSENRYVLQKNRGILAYYQGILTDAERLLAQADGAGVSFREEIRYYLARIAEDRRDTVEACRRWHDYRELGPSGLFREPTRRADAARQIVALACP